jgi:Trk K+ transport system NAD-binding subunit
LLVATGIVYFVLAGRFVLPSTKSESSTKGSDPMSYFHDVYGVDYSLTEVVVPGESALVGHRLDDVETAYRVRIIASKLSGNDANFGPGTIARDTEVTDGMVLGVVADPHDIDHFVSTFELKKRAALRSFSELLSPIKAGIAEVVIPPGSSLIGKSARDVWMRKTYGLALVGLHRNGETMREGDDIRNIPFQAGDTLVCHTPWLVLERIEKGQRFRRRNDRVPARGGRAPTKGSLGRAVLRDRSVHGVVHRHSPVGRPADRGDRDDPVWCAQDRRGLSRPSAGRPCFYWRR